MSDECKEEATPSPKKRGFLQDDLGDNSSGRLMKISAFFIAALVAVIGVFLIAFVEGTASELRGYLVSIIGMFLGVATSAEIVQRIKGA